MKDIAQDAQKDHIDRTQAVLKEGKGTSLSEKAKAELKTSFGRGTFVRDNKRTETVKNYGKPVLGLAHFHNDITNNSTGTPSTPDRNMVGHERPMVFGSESLRASGKAILLIPQQEAYLNAREQTIDFSY